jgi:glycosyltransferase involved in cell wall biosynthesis
VTRLSEYLPEAGTDICSPEEKSEILPAAHSGATSVSLLTGCQDRPYAHGLSLALASSGTMMDFIGSDDLDGPQLRERKEIQFLNLRGTRRGDVGFGKKALEMLLYYARLVAYAARAKPSVFHILWNNKFDTFDRTLLMLYYKLLGKKVVLTAHNVNAGVRDSNDSSLNRLTLRAQYKLCDHIFVHTKKMKEELVEEFGVVERKVTVIPFGINNSVPDTDLTAQQARHRLGIEDGDKAILFFGNIGPYKGLEYLVGALRELLKRDSSYRLVIAGKLRSGAEKYAEEVQQMIHRDLPSDRVIQRIEFVPDEETEVYFKAADLFVLPYRFVSQSGVLFLGYSFGLPAVVTDVGSLREEIEEGKTGFVCQPCDPSSLAEAIERYFASPLYRDLDNYRPMIRQYAKENHGWDVVAKRTMQVYVQLVGTRREQNQRAL